LPDKPGAPALAAEVTVALAIVRRLQGWSYRMLASEVDGSIGWRWVCSLYYHPMPTFQAIQGREALLKPKTLRVINRVVVGLAGQVGLTSAVRLRLDATVTETNVHYPTDSSLLDDAARVLSRCLKRAAEVCLPPTAADRARAVTAGRVFIVDAAAARADTTAYALLHSLAHSLHPTVIKA
jgi:IS5 family transposase